MTKASHTRLQLTFNTTHSRARRPWSKTTGKSALHKACLERIYPVMLLNVASFIHALRSSLHLHTHWPNQKWKALLEHSLCARHYSKCFLCVNSVNPHNNPWDGFYHYHPPCGAQVLRWSRDTHLLVFTPLCDLFPSRLGRICDLLLTDILRPKW